MAGRLSQMVQAAKSKVMHMKMLQKGRDNTSRTNHGLMKMVLYIINIMAQYSKEMAKKLITVLIQRK